MKWNCNRKYYLSWKNNREIVTEMIIRNDTQNGVKKLNKTGIIVKGIILCKIIPVEKQIQIEVLTKNIQFS